MVNEFFYLECGLIDRKFSHLKCAYLKCNKHVSVPNGTVKIYCNKHVGSERGDYSKCYTIVNRESGKVTIKDYLGESCTDLNEVTMIKCRFFSTDTDWSGWNVNFCRRGEQFDDIHYHLTKDQKDEIVDAFMTMPHTSKIMKIIKYLS